jgi:hypothetical protein
MADDDEEFGLKLDRLRFYRRMVADLKRMIEPDPQPTEEELRLLALPEAQFYAYLKTLKRDAETLQRILRDDIKVFDEKPIKGRRPRP